MAAFSGSKGQKEHVRLTTLPRETKEEKQARRSRSRGYVGDDTDSEKEMPGSMKEEVRQDD